MATEEQDIEVVDGEVVEDSRELTVVDRYNGEVIDVRESGSDRLAEAMLNADRLRDQLREAEGVVSGELLRRMDAEAKWTQRVPIPGEAGREYEIKGASPTAGTTSYDVETLEAELLPLVEAGTIARALFEEVVKRTVVVKIDAHDTGRLEKFAKSLGAAVQESKKATDGGVKRLQSLANPEVDAAVEKAKRFMPSNRKATVKIKDRAKEKRS